MKILICVLCLTANLFANKYIYQCLAKYYKYEENGYYRVDTLDFTKVPVLNVIDLGTCKNCREITVYDIFCKDNKFQQSMNYVERKDSLIYLDVRTKKMEIIQPKSIQARACREIRSGRWPSKK